MDKIHFYSVEGYHKNSSLHNHSQPALYNCEIKMQTVVTTYREIIHNTIQQRVNSVMPYMCNVTFSHHTITDLAPGFLVFLMYTRLIKERCWSAFAPVLKGCCKFYKPLDVTVLLCLKPQISV